MIYATYEEGINLFIPRLFVPISSIEARPSAFLFSIDKVPLGDLRRTLFPDKAGQVVTPRVWSDARQ